MVFFSKAEYRSVLMDYKFKESDGFPCIQATDGTFMLIQPIFDIISYHRYSSKDKYKKDDLEEFGIVN